MLGAPGVGKGTQAGFLMERYGIAQISTGDMLRNASGEDSERGRAIGRIMKSGMLVPDDLMIKLVVERISRPDCAAGFLLDGFPRTMSQAQALHDSGVRIDHVIVMDVPDDEIVERLSGRRIHLKSGRVYHVNFNPPKVHDRDDVTGEILVQRPDDQKATVLKRLSVYREITHPLIHFYEQQARNDILGFHVIRGTGPVVEIRDRVIAALD